MARLFTDGAEMGDVSVFTSTTGTLSASTVQKRSGSYSYYMNGGVGFIDIGSESEFYFRCGFYRNTTTASQVWPCRWYNSTTALGGLIISTTGVPSISVTNSLTTYVASSSGPLTVGQWYLLEVHVKIANSGGVVELKIDGVLDPDCTYTGDTQPGTATTVTQISMGASILTCYLDDIAVNNTSGASDNSWCGNGHVIALTPNANGDSSDLVGSDGNSTDNYLLVDEVPSDDDTTYVESSTPDDYDLYNLTACGLSNVNILRVWAESRAKDTTTGAGTVKLVVKTESTEYDSSGIDLATSYAAQKGTDHTVNPNTSAAWTTTQLDALQVGMKVVD